MIPVNLVIHEAFFFDVTQGQMNEAPIETRTHSGSFACQACKLLHQPGRLAGNKCRCEWIVRYKDNN